MGKGMKLVLALLVVVVVVGGIVVLTGKDQKDNGTSPSSSNSSTSNGQVAATITYNSHGWSPDTTTVKAGDTVKVTNNGSEEIQFASDPHPVHTDEPELNIGDLGPGQSKTFKVTKQGTWGFHNHYNPSQHGELQVN